MSIENMSSYIQMTTPTAVKKHHDFPQVSVPRHVHLFEVKVKTLQLQIQQGRKPAMAVDGLVDWHRCFFEAERNWNHFYQPWNYGNGLYIYIFIPPIYIYICIWWTWGMVPMALFYLHMASNKMEIEHDITEKWCLIWWDVLRKSYCIGYHVVPPGKQT